MPTITNLGDYGKLPASLKAGLFTVLEQATQLVRRKYPGAMSDSLRTKLFASKLNGRLGKPNCCNRFAYVDIVLSYSTVLPSHLDKKNAHCPGYDHCAVHTFAANVSGRVCRVAVFMTSRIAAGAWLEDRLGPKNKQKNAKPKNPTFIAPHISS